MNFQIASDLHLDKLYVPSIRTQSGIEVKDYKDLIRPRSNILILAGDICHISNVDRYTPFFEYVSENFQYVLYIPGNHEFYNSDLEIEELEINLEKYLYSFKNIFYLNNKSIVIEDILFTGSCLWCSPNQDPPAWFKINIDRYKISDMFEKSVSYLEKVSSINYKKHVVITHYPPMPLNFAKVGKKANYEDYYQNNHIFLNHPPLYWIFGHTHENFDDVINGTHYISNQKKDRTYINSYTISI